MNEKAKDIPAGCYGMMCTFSDVMNYVSWRHASPSFMNFDFDPDKYNRYTFYRAIMENTALVTYGHMKLVEESTGNMPDEVIFAGGASKSDLWCQILADVLGKPVSVVATGDFAASVTPFCRREITVDEKLIMRGLWLIYQRNRRG